MVLWGEEKKKHAGRPHFLGERGWAGWVGLGFANQLEFEYYISGVCVCVCVCVYMYFT